MAEAAQQERHVKHLPCALESFAEGSIFFRLSDTIKMIQNLKDISLLNSACSLAKWINPEKPQFPLKPVVSRHPDWVCNHSKTGPTGRCGHKTSGS